MSIISRILLDPVRDVTFYVGQGGPSGINAPLGSLYSQVDGTVSSMLHLKTGTGINDWSPVQAGGVAAVNWTEIVGKPIGLVSSSAQVVLANASDAALFARRNTNNTFTGVNVFEDRVYANGTTAQFRGLQINTNNSARWFLYQNAEAELGGNAGGSLRIARYDDSGNYIDDVILFSRQTGITTIGPVNSEGLNVAGVRGRFSLGSDGNGIHLFSNVDVGNPNGWGAGFVAGQTPSRGLSTFGAVNLGYGTTNISSIWAGLTVWAAGQSINLRELGGTHAYIGWQQNNGTRKAYLGFPSNGNDDFQIVNEFANGPISLFAAGSRRAMISAGGVSVQNIRNLATNIVVMDFDTTYTRIRDNNERVGIFVGSTADPNNYYDNTSHRFRNRDGNLYAEFIGNTTQAMLRFRIDANGADRPINGWVYSDDSGFGLLNMDGAWALRMNRSSRVTDHRATSHRFYNNNETTLFATVNSSGVTATDFVLS